MGPAVWSRKDAPAPVAAAAAALYLAVVSLSQLEGSIGYFGSTVPWSYNIWTRHHRLAQPPHMADLSSG